MKKKFQQLIKIDEEAGKSKSASSASPLSKSKKKKEEDESKSYETFIHKRTTRIYRRSRLNKTRAKYRRVKIVNTLVMCFQGDNGYELIPYVQVVDDRIQKGQHEEFYEKAREMAKEHLRKVASEKHSFINEMFGNRMPVYQPQIMAPYVYQQPTIINPYMNI